MKINVCYEMNFDIDVPEDGISAIKEMALKHLDEGDAFNSYIIEQNDKVRKALDLCSGAEILAVYNQDYTYNDGTVIYNNDLDEILWED